uniref:Uncharacterized protein n=1 Tax=Lactuca sativa TaxID=4236 RepID=A0A9R1V755_LACSA|nr:hypothetical protein LSAT_V11C600308900 [Lactuca sativa]
MDELKKCQLNKFLSEAVAAVQLTTLFRCFITHFNLSLFIASSKIQRFFSNFGPRPYENILSWEIFRGCRHRQKLKGLEKAKCFKLILELLFDGVIEDTGIFITIIRDLASLEHLKDRDTAHTNLSFLAIFARHARYFIGLSHAGEELVEEGLNITSDQKKVFKKAFHTYHDAAVELLRS